MATRKLSMDRRQKDTHYKGHLAGCSALAFVLYLNTLNAGFVYDDRRAILGNADVTGVSPFSLSQLLQHDYWGTELTDSGSHGSWRPLCVLSFRLNFLLGGGYHLINVLLHCLATLLVVLVARTLLPTRSGILATGLVFASHPIHTEAVAGLVGRADLAACVCYLLTYLAYRRHMQKRDARSLVLTLLLAMMGLLCKETAITALLLCGMCDVLMARKYEDKHRLRSLSILSISLASFLYCRLNVLPRPGTAFASADNPTAHEPCWWSRTLTFFHLPVVNFQLLLWPQRLSFDWGMDAVVRIRSLWDARNLLTIGFYATLMTIIWKSLKLEASTRMDYMAMADISLPLLKRLGGHSCLGWQGHSCSCHYQLDLYRYSSNQRLAKEATKPNDSPSSVTLPSLAPLVALSFLVLPFLPATNMLFYVGFVVAERLLYLPSVGYCLIFGYGFGQLWQRKHFDCGKILLLCCLSIIVGAFSLRTIQRNSDWRNEEELYRSAIHINPPKALGNLGSILSSQGRYDEAKLVLEAAIRHRSTMADAHFNLGIVHQQQQNFTAALPCYRRAIQLRPQLAAAYLNLAASLQALGQHQEAISVLQMGIRLPGHAVRDRLGHEKARRSASLQLSLLYTKENQSQLAIKILNEGLTKFKDMPKEERASFHLKLGEIYVELGQWQQAQVEQRLAMEAQPRHGATYTTFGQTLAKNSSRYGEAELWFKRAIQLSPLEPSVHHHYADFLEQQERHRESLTQRLNAVALAPNNYVLHAAVADAMRLLKRLPEAELWYRKAVNLQPRAAHAHANLGAILQMRGQQQQAVDCYRMALKLQPGHAISRANLAKMNVNIDTNT
ncbi:protein O-mannosyl-transferase TMTC1 isoform X1 [Drosophila willistoni]|nr:protein O-mannosyl-transferase TMTC1 isoform X1 [Drosophila willistoni]